jgi:hypothetical protein
MLLERTATNCTLLPISCDDAGEREGDAARQLYFVSQFHLDIFAFLSFVSQGLPTAVFFGPKSESLMRVASFLQQLEAMASHTNRISFADPYLIGLLVGQQDRLSFRNSSRIDSTAKDVWLKGLEQNIIAENEALLNTQGMVFLSAHTEIVVGERNCY